MKLSFKKNHKLTGLVITGLALFVSATAAIGKKTEKIPASRSVQVRATSVSFSVISQKKYGDLKWSGGLNLSSGYKNFGGFSGIELSADGKKMLAVTDRGYWLKADLVYHNNRITGVKNSKMGILLSSKGRKLKKKRTQDAETITLLSGNLDYGYALIGFERLQRIGKFKIRNGELAGPDYYVKIPEKLRRAPRNKGLEAVTVLKAGRYRDAVLALPERYKDKRGNLRGWILTKTGSYQFRFKRRGGFDVTDMAALPDGSLLVLERRFKKPKGFMGLLSNNIIKMRIRHIAEKDIRPGKLMDGRVLLEANRRFRIDNMEGMAVHKAENGDQIVTLISDDNFSVWQDTLLLQFVLPK